MTENTGATARGEPNGPGETPEPQPPRDKRNSGELPAKFVAPPIAQQLLAHLSSGQPAAPWLRANGLDRLDLQQWTRRDEAFAAQYARARAAGHDAIAEDLLAIADAPLPAGPDATAEAQRRRLAIDARKWLLARWDGRYADRPEAGATSVSVTIATGVPGQAPSASRITVESSAPRALPDAGDDDAE